MKFEVDVIYDTAEMTDEEAHEWLEKALEHTCEFEASQATIVEEGMVIASTKDEIPEA